VEAVIDKDQEIAEQLDEHVHGRPPQCLGKLGQQATAKANAVQASAGSRAQTSVSSMRSAISSAAPPITMDASSPSVNSRCFPVKPAMPGSSTATIIWRSASPATAT